MIVDHDISPTFSWSESPLGQTRLASAANRPGIA
jgi:hypothetical protein